MCWAAADRAALVADRFAPDVAEEFRNAAARIREEIVQRAWSEKRGAFVGSYDGDGLDASLLQMAPLRLFPADDPRLLSTIDAIWKELPHDGWLMRYREDDGLGKPSAAFILCTFWLIETLVAVGRVGRGAHAHGRRRRHRLAARLALRGLRHRPAAAVRQLPAGLFARRPHSRGVRRGAHGGPRFCEGRAKSGVQQIKVICKATRD